jgi:hypothetical protein
MVTSRKAIPRTPKSIDLKAPGTGSDQDPQAGTPGGPITGNQVVPCPWQKTPKNGPMIVAGDKGLTPCNLDTRSQQIPDMPRTLARPVSAGASADITASVPMPANPVQLPTLAANPEP